MFKSLRAKILGLVLLSVPIAVAGIAVSIMQYRAQIAHAERLIHAADIAAALDDLFALVLQASNTSRRFVLSDDPDKLEEYQTAVRSVPASLETIRALISEQPDFEAEFSILRERLDNKLGHLESILAKSNAGEIDELQSLLISSGGLERLEAFRKSVAAFRSIEYRLANLQLERFRISVVVQFLIVILLITIGGVWAMILGNETIRKVLIPVSSMISQVQRIAAGNFSEMIPVAQEDEIGHLSEQINQMTASLRTAHEARERAQADLAAERQNLVDALEALDEGFVAYDRVGRLIRCNEKYLDFFPAVARLAKPGTPYETLLRRRDDSGSEIKLENENADFVRTRLEESKEDAHTRELTLADGRILRRSSHRTRNGGRVSVYIDQTDVKQAQNALVELNKDLDLRVKLRTTDLNRANEKLQRLNTEMEALILSAPVAIVSLSQDRGVRTWNPAAVEMMGLSIGEVSTGLSNIVDTANAEALVEFLDHVYHGKKQANLELSLRHADGATIEASISASALSDRSGNPTGAILAMVDLTEARALQRQANQSQKMEVVARLTAGLAHDFNNLLAIIISNIELLESRLAQQSPEQNMLSAAKKASMSGVALNKKLLAFSRDRSLQVEGIDIKVELESLEPLLSVTLGEERELSLNVAPNVWPTLADSSLLQSAFLNLVVNARDAMVKGGLLEISVENYTVPAAQQENGLAGDFVRISFSDGGEGMSAEVLSQAFQPFFTTKSFGEGSGLGLSMVYGFVKQSGGDVHIASSPNVGTTVTILLPRAEINSSDARSPTSDTEIPAGHGETILVVEDNADMRRAVALQLADMGYAPLEADCAATALDLLEAGISVDLLLTDIVMPGGINGRELARKIRATHADLPILLMSGYPADTANAEATTPSDSDFKVLAKPVNKRMLGSQIHSHLS